jgi:hypothetical protein
VNQMAGFTLGSDPEFMLTKDGKYVSAIGIVPGDKYERHEIGKHQYYYDNVMAECAVNPGKDRETAIHNFKDCFQKFATLVKPCKLMVRASQNYPISELEHPKAKEIGCDPEYCTYELCRVDPPKQEFIANTLRTAGGHIHLGHKLLTQDEMAVYFTIRMLDLFLGIPSVFIDTDKTAVARRKLYGKSGRFRRPPHGAEYRSLGNFWLASPKLVGLVYDVCEFTINFVKENKHLDFWKVDLETLASEEAWNTEGFNPANCHICFGYDVRGLRDAIDTSNKTKAKKFWKLIEELMPDSLYDRLRAAEDFPPFDFYREWIL